MHTKFGQNLSRTFRGEVENVNNERTTTMGFRFRQTNYAKTRKPEMAHLSHNKNTDVFECNLKPPPSISITRLRC